MDYIRLIRSNRDFGRLWAAQLVSLLGDWFSTIVISALVVAYTEGTGYQGLAVSGFLIARMIPPLMMRPLAGVLADRFDRKRLMIASDLLRAPGCYGAAFHYAVAGISAADLCLRRHSVSGVVDF